MCTAADMVMPTPAASSTAPVPRSQESRWPPISTISSGRLAPVISPITFCEVYSPSQPQSSARRRRTGPRASRRASWSASGTASAADGTGSRPSSKRVMPVCGLRCESVPAERIRNPAAPARIAAEGPRLRTREPGP